jgi:hypothetical protein
MRTGKDLDEILIMCGPTYKVTRVKKPGFRECEGYIDLEEKEIYVNPDSFLSRREIIFHELIHHVENKEYGGRKISERLITAIARTLDFALTYNPELREEIY